MGGLIDSVYRRICTKLVPREPKLLINAVTGEVKSWYGTCPVRRLIGSQIRPKVDLEGWRGLAGLLTYRNLPYDFGGYRD